MSITPVSPIVEMKIGGTWTDVTPDIRLSSAHSGGGIRIKRGIPNEGTVAEPTQVDFVLNNSGGKYSPKNEMSVNYGLLGRNTPIRFGLLRREDSFAHTEVDTWGRMPSWTDSENNTILGDKWRLTGNGSRFDITGGVATIASTTGLSAATFGMFGDCEVVTRVKVSARDSEFGIMMRMVDPANDEQDWEIGVGDWVASGGSSTLQLSTTQVHTGTRSGLLTVAGSPATAGIRGQSTVVTPGRQYRLRVWVRCSTARTVNGTLNWFYQNGTTLSTDTTGTAVAANTWTLIEVDAVAPDEAYYLKAGPDLLTSPANGTLLFADDIEILENDNPTYFSAYITPGATDQIRIGLVWPGGNFQNTSINTTANIVAGDYWWLKVQWTGIRRRVKWWKDGTTEPTAWQIRNYDVVARSDRWPMPKAGSIGLFAKDGTSTISFDSFQVTVWRAHVEIAELPPRWDLSRTDQWVPISARGITRRLGQGRKVLESPTKLYFNSYLNLARAYYPLEAFETDGDSVPNAVAGTFGRAHNLQLGTPDLTGALALPGVSGYAEFTEADSYLEVKALPSATSGKWSYFNYWRIPAWPANDVIVTQIDCSGTIAQWRVILQSNGMLRIEGWTSLGALVITKTSALYPVGTVIPVGSWIAGNLYVFDSGGTITWAYNYHRPGTANFYTNNSTIAGSAGTCLGAQYYSNADMVAAGNLSVAHALVYPEDLPFVTSGFARAAYAYIGEECITRWLRIGGNSNIKVSTTGFSAESKPMGAQTMNKPLVLMEEAATVDFSLHMEERDDAELNLRTRESLYTQVPVDLDVDLGHLTEPMEPTDDDQSTRNYVTIRRTNGGAATSFAADGPLNINAPEDDQNGVGLYDEAPEYNYATDSQLQSAANFKRALGTQDVVRYPSLKANLNSEVYDDDPYLTACVLALDTGDLVRVRNTEVGYEPTYQLIYGYEEFFDQYDYALVFNTKPGEVYNASTVGYSTRLDTKSHALAADFHNGDKYIQVQDTSGTGRRFVTLADDPKSFPFDVLVRGARWTVNTVGDLRNATVSLQTGLGTWVSGVAGRLFWGRMITVGRVPQRNFGAILNNTGGSTRIDARDIGSVTVGQTYEASCWLKLTATSTNCGVDLFWYNASMGSLGSLGGSGATQTAADGWKHYRASGVAPASAAFAQVAPYAVIANGQKVYFDEGRLLNLATATGQPQYLSVNPTPVNGVTKQLNAGWAATIAEPWRVAF